MKVPRLCDEADRVGACARRRSCKPGSFDTERPARFTMPKAVNAARLVRLRSKKAVSVGLAPGIAAFDIVDAELVEHSGDEDLVLERKVDARRLLAVAQRRVEEVEPFLHRTAPSGGHRSVS